MDGWMRVVGVASVRRWQTGGDHEPVLLRVSLPLTYRSLTSTREVPMKRIVLPVAAAAVLVAGIAAVATAGPDRCSESLAALNEHRAEQVGIRAAYAISVRNGYAGHVARLGPRMVAGEQQTSHLVAAMYEACD